MLFRQDPQIFSIKLKRDLLVLDTPILMGILNLTQNSFYDGGTLHGIDDILSRIETMLEEGATIIDIGAMSSRPFSEALSISEELKPLETYLPKIMARFSETYFSIDTYRSTIAQFALENGVCMLNDISAYRLDKELISLLKKHQVPYVLMHMKGIPQDMQMNPEYDNLLLELYQFFDSKIMELKSKGISDIILDLGFGFGKRIEDNYKLLKNLSYFHTLDLPILTGISRKSMIYKPLGSTAKDALNGSSALHFEALRQGSKILRVHDVKEAKEVITLYNLYEKS
jgi:dihydropteroate synthase